MGEGRTNVWWKLSQQYLRKLGNKNGKTERGLDTWSPQLGFDALRLSKLIDCSVGCYGASNISITDC